MPIDLRPAGLSYAYPKHALRLLPWLGIWLICNMVGVAAVLLLWSGSYAAKDPRFWFCLLGVPNLGFCLLFGLARLGYDVLWQFARHHNSHRNQWLATRVHDAQRSLQILGASHALPLGTQDLASVITDGIALPHAQPCRGNSRMIVHNRFDDDDASDEHPPTAERQGVSETVGKIAPVTQKITEALRPLKGALLALSQYGPTYAPVVQVLARPDTLGLRFEQVTEAMMRLGLPPLDCRPVSADVGLMLADMWLDLTEYRPLLILAVEWHDQEPPADSSEGCVAVLLAARAIRLPEPVKVLGRLHRPVAGQASALGDLLQLTLRWGRTPPSMINHAWIAGFGSMDESEWLAACEAASLNGAVKDDGGTRLDRLVGSAGPVDAWLPIAAAIEVGAIGAQLIVNGAQAAVFYLNPSEHGKPNW